MFERLMYTEDEVRKLIEKDLKKEDIDIKKIEYVNENNIYYLRVYIDKKPYVDVDTCVLASTIISPLIDNISSIDNSYVLDVCSSGEVD